MVYVSRWAYPLHGRAILNRFELAKIGNVCLNKGEWKGKRIVSSEWIQEASRASDYATDVY